MAQHESSSLELRRSSIATDVATPRTLIWVRGEQDIATRAELSDTLVGASAGAQADLVVDLSLVTFMDASTVGAIVGARKLLGERSHELTVRAPSQCARRVLDICGLSDLVDSEEEDEVASEARTGALSTWVEVPAVDPALPRPGS